VVDFVEIFKVCTRKAIIKAAKRIFNSDKICHSYCDFYFGVTFLEHSIYFSLSIFSNMISKFSRCISTISNCQNVTNVEIL